MELNSITIAKEYRVAKESCDCYKSWI